MERERTKELHKAVQPFAKSDRTKSIFQLMNTIIPLVAMWVIAYMIIDQTIVGAIALSIGAAFFAIRTFIIFHDCTHGSFFKNKKANAVWGTITGILTMFGYSQWRHEHLLHHASSSNLDARGVGDIWMMTVEEYQQASKMKKIGYRLYRNPLVMFGLGPLFLLLVVNRKNRRGARMPERMNTYFTNIVLVVLYGAVVYFLGLVPFLLVTGLSMYIAAMLGVWLFYIQHTFEDSYFEEKSEWSYVKAAVEGSSYYKLPAVLQWLTGNIGFHHVHHLAPRIPNYALEEAHEKTPPLQYATTITLKLSLASLKFKLYDPETYQFITFKQLPQHIRKTSVKPILPIKKIV